MELKDYELMRKADREYKINVIINHRDNIGKPIDMTWLNKQSDRVINGMFYEIEISREKTKKEEVTSNQITIEDYIKDVTQQEDYIPDDVLQELLAASNEQTLNLDDYYDENGRLLSDVQRMKRREDIISGRRK